MDVIACFQQLKRLLRLPFYGNNVQAVTDLKMAYELAKKSPKNDRDRSTDQTCQ